MDGRLVLLRYYIEYWRQNVAESTLTHRLIIESYTHLAAYTYAYKNKPYPRAIVKIKRNPAQIRLTGKDMGKVSLDR